MGEPQEPPVFATDILDALPFPALLVDERHRVLYANCATRSVFGDSEAGGDSLCCRLVHGTETPPPECPLTEVIATGRTMEYTVHTEAEDTCLGFGLYPTGRRTAHGLRILLHTVRDISEERDAQEALTASEERYRTLAEAADDMIFIIDDQDVIQYANVNAAGAFGLSPAELVGRHQSEVFPPDIAEAQRAGLRAALGTGLSSRTESQVMFGDRPAWLDTILVPLATHEGRPRTIMGVSRDFTPRKLAEDGMIAAEAAARESEARLHHLLDTSPTVTYALAVTGTETTATWVSPNTHRVFGFNPQEAVQPGWWLPRLHPDDVEIAAEMVPAVLANDEASREYRIARADGTYRWILDEQRLVREEDGEPREIVGTWLDITDRKVVEAALEEGEKRLQHSQRMEAIGTLAGGIAHDFNNLLTAIGGYADLLLDADAAGEGERPEVLEIRRAARRAGDLTQQLLAFSRRQTLQPLPVDINQTVTGMRSMLERVLGEDIDLSTDLDPDLGFTEVDPSQFEQVILNLASNARDAMPTGGRLAFKTTHLSLGEEYVRSHPDARTGDHVCLMVRDTGAGMDPETLAHAFEPFYTTKPQGQGTGLGLASVYGITSQSGGHVTLESEEGIGSTVRVYLPRIPRPDTAETPPARPAPVARGGGETILVVEDEPAVLRFVTRVLDGLGYTVLSAGGPRAAAEVADSHQGAIHLLLTDVVMPEKGGRELALEISASRPATRVLFMSGHARDTMIRSGRLDHGIALLNKPFTREELAARIRHELDADPMDDAPPDREN
ncbi:MAG: PAS domain-containing hybrid sensor histidine kinase/response regulator [Thermoleophilia bacterium]